MTTIDTTAQTLFVDGVTDIVVTEAEQDTDTEWVREIRVFGEPLLSGGTQPVVLTLRLKSPVKANINVTSPPLDF